MKRFSAVEYYQDFLSLHLNKNCFCIDGTAGRGNDTLFLARISNRKNGVLGFDIQPKAVEETNRRLSEAGLSQVGHAVLDSHVNMKKYIEAGTADAIVFNFGYLPGGDHKIATKPSTSVQAVSDGLELLKIGGIMTLCLYSGGDSGYEEKKALLSFIRNLDSSQFIAIVSQYYNRENNPPTPVFLIKLK